MDGNSIGPSVQTAAAGAENVVMTESDSEQQENTQTQSVQLLDLPWEDVLFRQVFTCFTLPELFKLRAVNTLCHKCVSEFFTCCPVVNLVRISNIITAQAFGTATYNNYGLKVLVTRQSKGWLTDSVLVPALDVANRLLKLDLTGCTSISNASIQKVAISCPQLEEVSLRDCHWLSKEGVIVLAMNCHQLQRVDITACWEVDDESIIILTTFCPNLIYLSIAKIYGLTDRSILQLAKNCSKLRHLNMQGCWRVTDDAVKMLGEYCRSLKGLQVRECREVTEASLAKLRQRNIKVDIPQHPWQLSASAASYLNQLKLQI
nr:ubiquitin-ligase jetlag-like protein [Platynereis dumerilii]